MAVMTRQTLDALRAIVGPGAVLHQPEERLVYECDACMLVQTPPDVVVLPQTTEQVAAVVRVCHQAGVPVVPRGAGTGLSGGALAVEGGVVLSLNRLDAIEQIDVRQRCAWVQVGVVNATLNEKLAAYGLFYAPDPSSQAACTVGGNVAENAGGIHCLKYGVTTDHVLAVEGVLADGTSIRVGSPNGLQQQPGLDLLRLLVGSEGTLAVITRVCLRLLPRPAATPVLLATFATLRDASQAVSAIVSQGLQPAAMEFMDRPTIWAVNQAFAMGFSDEAEALLLIEASGSLQEATLEMSAIEQTVRQHAPQLVQVATQPTDCKRLWKARKGTVAGYGRLQPAFYVHDCVIPPSRLAEVLEGIAAIGRQHQLMVANVFHAGDGNLHPNLLFNPKDAAMVERVFAAGNAILQLCLSVGGTLSGEHGIGIEKIGFMNQQFSALDLSVMRQVKRAFDAEEEAGGLNPGKIIPLKRTCGEAGLHGEECTVAAGEGLPQRQPLKPVALTQDGETGLWI